LFLSSTRRGGCGDQKSAAVGGSVSPAATSCPARAGPSKKGAPRATWPELCQCAQILCFGSKVRATPHRWISPSTALGDSRRLHTPLGKGLGPCRPGFGLFKA
uniref:Uncharacterized protein n=1 Tax=Aegilops tauschii subsp. strangulata TaxID=200361 RepID=A0A453T8E4_AEGTS